MRAGALRRQVALQTRIASKDTFGQASVSWTTTATTWADIEPLSGRELMAAQAQQAETTHKVSIRYRSGVTPAMRVVYQGRNFNVLSVLDDDMAHKSLTLLCSEGMTNG
jgi:SPP1 family predicted phage head-tail adaptor